MPTTVSLAHPSTNRRTVVGTDRRVVMQGSPSGYWLVTHHDYEVISPLLVREVVEILQDMGWVVVTD